MQKLLLLMIVFFLASCSFQMRGELPLAPPLHHLYLQTPDPYGQLARNLRQFLKMSNVQLADNPQSATTILTIISEEPTQQLLSISPTQQTRQYNLILTVAFEVSDNKGVVLVPRQTVSETRTLPIESNQILAGSNEANTLYQQMRLAIVYDMMSRLASDEITHLLTEKK